MEFMMIRLIASIVLIFSNIGIASQGDYMKDNSPQKIIIQMLDSVKTKDLETFVSLFKPGQDVFGIFPAGNTASGYESFMESQQNWFNSPDGEFNYTIVRKYEEKKLALYGIEVDFKTPDNVNMNLYISILLKNIGDSWHFVHFQNTMMNDPE